MKKIIIKPIVLLLVFIGALITFSFTTNWVNQDLTAKMADATFPVIYFYKDQIKINELHGYVQEMDAVSMRDAITPVGEDRLLPLSVSTYGNKIDKLSYEIRSLDAQRLVAEAEVSNLTGSKEEKKAEIKVQNILFEDEEYLMILCLESGGNTYYYYTRLMQTQDQNVGKCLAFAMEFHDMTFNKEEGGSFFPTYMDPATGDTTTLHYVDLSCTVNQIMWADFEAEVLTEPIALFKEINSSYQVITLEFLLSHTNEEGENEYYNVEEYFRLRQTDSRMYVLNYERRMNQIFQAENKFLVDSVGIQLGIRETNVDYKKNEAGNIVCFVQEGDLWCYNTVSREIVRIFSFRNLEGNDVRNNWNQHDIKIVRIDEAGSVDFIVYGYMNRGEHEGEVGTAVYHYDGLAYTIEEEAFIPSLKSFEILKAEMGQLMYENDNGLLYFMLEGNVYSIDLNDLKVRKIISGLKTGCYAVSASNQFFAWVESEQQYQSNVIHMMNLKNEEVYEISEGSKKYLRSLGFIEEDFIYGIANAKEVKADAAGNIIFPMKSIKIMDTSDEKHTILKEYKPQKNAIEGISIKDSTITVNLMKKVNGQYIAAGADSIMNRDAKTEGLVSVVTSKSDIKQTQVQLAMSNAIEVAKTKFITSKEVVMEEERYISLGTQGDERERFFVYVKGDVVLATDSISDAISMANSRMGAVIDSKQQYVWIRARKNYCNAFSDIKPTVSDENQNSIVKCISAMLERADCGIAVGELVETGSTPKEILETTLKNSVVFDLTGCSAEDVLFYISEGSPVFAMTGKDSAVLIIGYSATNIYYYDPDSTSTKSVTFEKADEMFLNGGNKFLTYLNK